VIGDAPVEDAREWCEDIEEVEETTQLSHVHGNFHGTAYSLESCAIAATKKGCLYATISGWLLMHSYLFNSKEWTFA
jgi:hypothetical protein